MKIAITSGKGGVGKTFIATCLADVLTEKQQVSFIDCDVEAPNAHLFLKPDRIDSQPQYQPCVESMDSEKCDLCGKCAKACYFNAIVVGKKTAMTFPELCRWCGSCQIVCPNDAIIIGQRKIGDLYSGKVGQIDLSWAVLQTGAGGMTVTLIEKLKQKKTSELTIYDSPPGTSCPVVHTVRHADCVVLVTDPTRFGIHDLKLSVRMCRSMDIQPLIIINRAETGSLAELRNWCNSQGLEIIGSLPDSRDIAECYSSGKLVTQHMPDIRKIFSSIADTLISLPKPVKKTNVDKTKASVFLSEPIGTSAEERTTTAQNPVEIAVVSGKGGSGKTSLSACFTQLAKTTVVDCDVDAADLHLLFEPKVLECQNFVGGRKMRIDPQECVSCGLCFNACRFNAIRKTDENSYMVIEDNCEGCGACLQVCPAGAVMTEPSTDGRWYFSAIRTGKMSHATLSPGRENSGKLVTLIRKNAAAKSSFCDSQSPIVLDGAPGTGCPVIASIGGTKFAVLVTEPTVSGMHDLKRIHELTKHFGIPAGIVINKADINHQVSQDIEKFAKENNIPVLGKLPYNMLFTDAQQHEQTLLEYAGDTQIAKQIRVIWKTILENINERNISYENCNTSCTG
jgi:MinD superfamily P-loop ATPase